MNAKFYFVHLRYEITRDVVRCACVSSPPCVASDSGNLDVSS